MIGQNRLRPLFASCLVALLALLPAMETTAVAADKKDSPTPKVESPSAGDAARMGLTIMGDTETPLGLFITPWKNAYPPLKEDRPALLLDESARPLDPDAFHRQSDYDEAYTTYRSTGALP
jgi:hypothetical protein